MYHRKLCPRWIPTRVIICIMMFSACWTSYMCRLQMAILAVPMIKTQADGGKTSGACVDDAKEEAQNEARTERGRRSLLLDPHDGLYLDEYTHMMVRRELGSEPTNASLPSAEKEEGEFDLSKISQRSRLFSGEPFNWTPFVRGQLIGAYGWGNVPGNFIGGVAAQRFGPRQAILWSSLIAATVSLVTPAVAHIHWGALAFTRIIIGVMGGVTFPCCHTLVARWAPPDEKGRFVWTLQGGTFGSIFLFGMISGIAESINWEAGWYIPAIMTFVWTFFWYLLAFDSPEEHPGITDTEKDYILTAQAGIVQKERPPLRDTPIVQILTSLPFICLILCHFGNLFLLFFYQNGMMLYQTKALGFKLTKGGVVSGLPWASRVLFAFFFGWAGDTIKRKQIISVTLLRKGATFFSHFLPGICLIIVGYLGCSFVWANVFLVLALGFNGAASISNLSNNQDLSPNYAGFLYGIMNTVGCLSGIIISPVVEEVAGKYGNPIEKWQILFWMGAAVCILCMVIFIVGGSAKVQPWNELKPSTAQGQQG